MLHSYYTDFINPRIIEGVVMVVCDKVMSVSTIVGGKIMGHITCVVKGLQKDIKDKEGTVRPTEIVGKDYLGRDIDLKIGDKVYLCSPLIDFSTNPSTTLIPNEAVADVVGICVPTDGFEGDCVYIQYNGLQVNWWLNNMWKKI